MSTAQPAGPQLTPYEAGRRFAEELLREHPMTPEMADVLATVLVRPRTEPTRRAS